MNVEEAMAKINGEDSRSQKTIKTIVDLLQGSRSDVILAKVLSNFSCSSMHLESLSFHFWDHYVKSYVYPACEHVFNYMTSFGQKEISYNDGDNKLSLIEDPKSLGRRIIVHRDQTVNSLFVWDSDFNSNRLSTFHVRVFYDHLDLDHKDHKELDDIFRDGVNEDGMSYAIRHSEDPRKWSDYKLTPYPDRLSLDYYVDKQFEMPYGDGRDQGYVFSCTPINDSVRMDQNVYRKVIFDANIPAILSGVYNSEPHDSLCGYFDGDGKLVLTETDSNYYDDEE